MFKFLKERINAFRGISTYGFKNIFIETNGICTNKCFCCPRCAAHKDGHAMTDEIFKKCISELKKINYSQNVHLYAQNEPFIDKKIIEKIYYTKEQLPNCKIILISNFSVLNDSLIEEILKAPIHNLSCSVYALDSETYTKICNSRNFKNSIINQIKFLKKYYKTQPFSFANYLINSKFLKDYDFIEHYLFDIVPVEFVQTGKVSTFFNSVHDKLKPSKQHFSHCIYNTLKINNEGILSICPVDYTNTMKIGEILNLKTNLLDAFNSPEARTIRKKMIFGKINDNNPCDTCDYRKETTLIKYLLGITNKKTKTDPYKHKLRTYRNSHEEVKEKGLIFDNIFKDGEEDKWIETLNDLRKDFYAKKDTHV